MKKTAVLTAILAFVFSGAVYADFSDMQGKSEEMINSVELLAQKRYVNGKSETEFEPDSDISRAEFAAVVLRMLDYMSETRPYYLTDVPKSAWYYYTAGSAAETGIMAGFEDGTFRGDDIIQRVQAVTIAARVLGERAEISGSAELGFADDVPDWAKEYIQTAASAGIIENSGSFNASEGLTRGEAAVMLARLYDRIKDTLDSEGYKGEFENKKPPVTIVLDAGHGKDSWGMSDEEKISDGWLWNDEKNQWGEWRHYKSGTVWQDCEGFDCNGRGSCWYRMENGDRDTEPEINLNNAKSAAKYLEEMGYEVRLTHGSNDENPSMTKRLIYCYPNNDTSAVPDADFFVCLHSNAGGGKGSAYIELSGAYDQKGIPEDYAYIGNTLGKYINEEITEQTSLSVHGSGKIPLPELILFCKSPVPIAYLEIGFFDNYNDLAILNSEYDLIGKAIAEGIDKYCRDTMRR